MTDKETPKDEGKDAKKKAEKVKRALFHTNFYAAGAIKYKAGEHYPLTAETQSRIVAGDAKPVEVEMDPDEHLAQHQAASAALKHEWRHTLAAEGEAVARGELKG